MSSSYAGDPRWITAKFDGACLKCGKNIKRGAPIWFYPPKYRERKGKAYCEPCGKPMARQFDMDVADEDFLIRQFIGGYDERRR